MAGLLQRALSAAARRGLAAVGAPLLVPSASAAAQAAEATLPRLAGGSGRRALSASAASSSAPATAADGGRIVVACVLERSPVVVPDPLPWKKEFEDWREAKNSRFAKEYPESEAEADARKIAAALKEENELSPEEQEIEWKPAPRRTAADASGDRSTSHRQLDQFLFLAVKSKATSAWGLPQTTPKPGESVRAAAERLLQQALGGSVRAYFVGNAPSGACAVPQAWDGQPGTLFYHTAQLLPDSRPALDPRYAAAAGVTELAWLTKEELGEGVCPEERAVLHAMLPGTRPAREPAAAGPTPGGGVRREAPAEDTGVESPGGGKKQGKKGAEADKAGSEKKKKAAKVAQT